jgi:hypothetical protein
MLSCGGDVEGGGAPMLSCEGDVEGGGGDEAPTMS